MDKTKLESLLISVDTTIKQAMQKLNATAEKILFVVDEDIRLLGTITDGDIRRAIINGIEFTAKVENIMYKKFIAVEHNLPNIGEQVKQIMIKHRVEQIPVLDDKGMISDVILWADFLEEKGKSRAKKVYSNKIVIMAGGKGTRLDPFTRVLPKPLIPIGDKPVIELIMENFYQYGFYDFIYTLNHKKEYIKGFLKENKYPYNISWIEEDDFLGTAGSLSLLKDKINNTCFVTNCDSLLIDVNFEEILAWHKEHQAAVTIVGCHNEYKIPFGILQLSDGKLEKILEKPVHDVIINTGVYVMEPHIISYVPEKKPMDMNELIDIVARKEKVTVYPIYNGWFDVGQWEGYKKSLECFKISN